MVVGITLIGKESRKHPRNRETTRKQRAFSFYLLNSPEWRMILEHPSGGFSRTQIQSIRDHVQNAASLILIRLNLCWYLIAERS